MREAQHEHAKSEAALESALSHCLMDSDAESLRLARRNRRKSMLLSTGIQAALLTAAVVLPLFASQALPLIINDPPIPFPKGIRVVDPLPAGGERTHTSSETRTVRIPLDAFQPPRVPKGTPPIDDRGEGPTVSGQVPGLPGPFGDRNGVDGLENLIPERGHSIPPPPPVEQKPPRPRRISVVHPAKLLHKVEPVYPPLMKQIHKSGRVEFRAIIARDGSIQELTLLGGDPGFVLSAQQAVLQWRYAPTILNGEAVEVETRITVIFTMQ